MNLQDCYVKWKEKYSFKKIMWIETIFWIGFFIATNYVSTNIWMHTVLKDSKTSLGLSSSSFLYYLFEINDEFIVLIAAKRNIKWNECHMPISNLTKWQRNIGIWAELKINVHWIFHLHKAYVTWFKTIMLKYVPSRENF